MIATIEYQIATYRGTVDVRCEPNDEIEVLFARARRKLANSTSLPYGYESFKVVNREYEDDDAN
jgi:hypothetical protein